jgi:hypothetical protein
MALDVEVSNLLKQQMATSSARGVDLNGVIDKNLVQGLGVVHNSLVHSVGATADDAQIMASLQAAATSPKQGAVAAAKA